MEINRHGGLIPLQGVLERILELGARLAEPGEFTKRAFLHGRLDLSQAEAVIDVIRAKTDRGHRLAMRQLEAVSGSSRRCLVNWWGYWLALRQGSIFLDEVEIWNRKRLGRSLMMYPEDCQDVGNSGYRSAAPEGIDTAIVGKPNVGKSSLLNRLVRENRAIVTDVPSTTGM